MPYKMITQLPDNVKNNLPKHAQKIYKEASDEENGEGHVHAADRSSASSSPSSSCVPVNGCTPSSRTASNSAWRSRNRLSSDEMAPP